MHEGNLVGKRFAILGSDDIDEKLVGKNKYYEVPIIGRFILNGPL